MAMATGNAVELSATEARRVALRAQGFASRPTRVDVRAMRKAIAHVHAIQIDSVSTLVRTQYLPLFSRLGPYDTSRLDRLAYQDRELFEFKPRSALCFFPVALYPLFRWMTAPEQNPVWTAALEQVDRARPGYVESVIAEIETRGPLAYTELTDPGRIPKEERVTKYAASTVLWNSWSLGDRVISALARTGRLVVAARKGLEPQFDLVERVIPQQILSQDPLQPSEAQRELVRLSLHALGVGTVKDLAGYFRLPVSATRQCLRDLADAGLAEHADVEGWRGLAFLAPGADGRAGGMVTTQTLLSPFDSLLWDRDRTTRLFDFEHVFELYVPAAKRRFGYYVLPFLLDESIVARVDLKADRANSALAVLGAFAEESGVAPAAVAKALAEEVGSLATWLRLDRIVVGDRGDLVSHLRRALGRRRAP